jgi:hypothetical protein
LFACLFVCLPVCLFACLFVCLFVSFVRTAHVSARLCEPSQRNCLSVASSGAFSL